MENWIQLSNWIETWDQLKVPNSSSLKELHDEVLSRYTEPHRHYHTQQHLSECFEKVQPILSLALHPAEVQLALWFHDAIYDTQRSDNEEQSATWARSSVLSFGGPPDVGQRIYDLIMFTRHDAMPVGLDAEVLVDADLSILGSPPDRFDEYEQQVRKEYGWVPEVMFRQGRRKILKSFLERKQIFATLPFQELYEAQARENLRRSFESLG
jgi:predicted metal-dependent HD superfamily phosphohydrolase